MRRFEDFGLSEQLLTAIERIGIETPTDIQEKTIPHVLAGKDVIGESATGSGKTLAFGCGIIEHIVPRKGLQALILTPTRELAEQVRGSLNDLSYQKKIQIISVYGGVSIKPQIQGLRRAEVAVATPGRLLDHLQRRTIDTSKIKFLVLDEADCMLDMGFIEDVEKIIEACPKQRKTLLFTATVSPRLKKLANRYMINPTMVMAEKHVDPNKLRQVYYNVTKNQKLSLLLHLFQHETSGLAMVFCNTRRTTDFVVKNLRANKVEAVGIHGGQTQNKRANTMKMFNKSKFGVLVCTDVAARGLHIDNVSHIYNYEIPKNPTDYVHRIGRTARAGEEGKVINLLSQYDYDNFSRVQSDYRSFNIDKIDAPQMKRVFIVRDNRKRSFRKRQNNMFFGRRRFN